MTLPIPRDRYSDSRHSWEILMKRSDRIAASVTAVVIGGLVLFALVRILPARSRPPVGNTADRTVVSHGEVADDTLQELDKDAIAELERMGAYLRTLKAYQLKADVVTEDVRTDGQKVQIIRKVDLVARKPNRFFAEVMNDRQRRLFFYDGARFTLYAPWSSFYATVAAPPTIEKLADDLQDKYAIELPLVDLFRWGTSEANLNAITSAIDLGPSAINGVTCEQYAFRQD